MTKRRLLAIAHRLETAASFARETGRPAYARKLEEDAKYIRDMLK